jgi:hypothetical protein
MNASVRHVILRANALYIGVAGFAGVIFDIRGVLYGARPLLRWTPSSWAI